MDLGVLVQVEHGQASASARRVPDGAHRRVVPRKPARRARCRAMVARSGPSSPAIHIRDGVRLPRLEEVSNGRVEEVCEFFGRLALKSPPRLTDVVRPVAIPLDAFAPPVDAVRASDHTGAYAQRDFGALALRSDNPPPTCHLE